MNPNHIVKHHDDLSFKTHLSHTGFTCNQRHNISKKFHTLIPGRLPKHTRQKRRRKYHDKSNQIQCFSGDSDLYLTCHVDKFNQRLHAQTKSNPAIREKSAPQMSPVSGAQD